MIVTKALGNRNSMDFEEREVETVELEWYEMNKKILKKVSSWGEEVGFRMESHLHHGDVIYMDEKKVMVIDIKSCELIEIPVNSIKEMGKLCYEIGNRHLSVHIGEDVVKIPFDNPTFEHLKKLGFKPEKVVEKFLGFTESHGHSH
ncbi:MAG: urease accessory protein UreE [Clostridiaceae bacterium]